MANQETDQKTMPPRETGETEEAAGAAAEVEAQADFSARVNQIREEIGHSIRQLRDGLAQFDVAETTERTRAWVREHPGLAMGLALGAGVLVGGLVGRLLTPRPVPFPVRARRKAERLARQAGRRVRTAGVHLAAQAAEAGQRLADRAGDTGSEVFHRAEHAVEEQVSELMEALRSGAHRTYGFFESVLNTIRTAVLVVFVKRIADWFRQAVR
ncbi:hypothetical protein GQ464_018525 [Rhodocaloribacter litoris]|uniref:hypothetical protein n=1 Tax=Rhodocaloribacter litoris TaxID=2558931 RepID=UPI0014247077|nr:hypothetical protein [Rhodocaloribacter litoris]QXD15359.1 hypothetical protein GQ464_018525 [Rhodocaloribacter litoris]